ncbi:MAG: AAA family ATPase [Chloroflexi bacterium]|nr:AAA family ATPase [Chloroflexota bacterium]
MEQRFVKEKVQKRITDDLDALLEALPPHIAHPLMGREDKRELLEVVMDLGRVPQARFSSGDVNLSSREVTQEDIDYVVSRIGSFGDDHRAGIERTLHRISAFVNRRNKIVGLTCRVGRAVYGTIKIIEDLVQSGKSILLLGRPGVGKTTMLREVARVLADDLKKRVVIVDTSNEIAGDGDIPHPAIGHARRMQVKTPSMQHAVMIEAVENHMPEVIIIDEIGTELEAFAARTIAERGVQLVATAHGNILENLIMNPTLCDLVGGIQSVTLGDEEARRRGTQKSILERKAPPTFDIVVEIQNWEKVAIHPNVAEVVDALLRGHVTPPEVRWLDDKSEVRRARETIPTRSPKLAETQQPQIVSKTPKVYPFGIGRTSIEQVIRSLQLPVTVVNDLRGADVLITTRKYYRRKPQTLVAAEGAGVPIFVIRKNNLAQVEQSLLTICGGERSSDALAVAIQEAEETAEKVATEGKTIELAPQNAFVRRLQHQIAERYNIQSASSGREPFRRVRFFRLGSAP